MQLLAGSRNAKKPNMTIAARCASGRAMLLAPP
jgi:hypothetical protein